MPANLNIVLADDMAESAGMLNRYNLTYSIIGTEKTAQIYSAIQTGSGLGMQTLEMALCELCKKNLITKEDALAKASHTEELKRMLGMGGGGIQSARMSLG